MATVSTSSTSTAPPTAQATTGDSKSDHLLRSPYHLKLAFDLWYQQCGKDADEAELAERICNIGLAMWNYHLARYVRDPGGAGHFTVRRAVSIEVARVAARALATTPDIDADQLIGQFLSGFAYELVAYGGRIPDKPSFVTVAHRLSANVKCEYLETSVLC